MSIAGLKIAVDSVTRCLGRCAGCALTAPERADAMPWEPTLMAATAAFIRQLRSRLLPADPAQIHEFFVLCGQGDHLLLSPAESDALVAWLAQATGALASTELTTSLVGRPERLMAAAEHLHAGSIAAGVTLLPAVVFDPAKADHLHYGSPYLEMIAHLRRRFGTVDFGLNLGPDTVDRAPPERLHRFLVEAGFRHFEINLVPTVDTAARLAPSWAAMIAWLRALTRLAWEDRSYDLGHLYMLSTLSAALEQEDAQAVRARLVRGLSRIIHVDHLGQVSHALTGGTGALVALGPRVGLRAAADLARQPPEVAADRLPVSAVAQAARLIASYDRDRRCAACPVRSLCLVSGLAAVRSALGGQPGVATAECPVGIRPLLQDIAERTRRDGPVRHRLAFEAVQTGLDPAQALPAPGRGRAARAFAEPTGRTGPAWRDLQAPTQVTSQPPTQPLQVPHGP